MDKSWITKSRISADYCIGVEEFLDFAFQNTTILNRVRCPCKKCYNRYYHTRDTVRDHLVVVGIQPYYTEWRQHGENVGTGVAINTETNNLKGKKHASIIQSNLTEAVDARMAPYRAMGDKERRKMEAYMEDRERRRIEAYKEETEEERRMEADKENKRRKIETYEGDMEEGRRIEAYKEMEEKRRMEAYKEDAIRRMESCNEQIESCDEKKGIAIANVEKRMQKQMQSISANNMPTTSTGGVLEGTISMGVDRTTNGDGRN